MSPAESPLLHLLIDVCLAFALGSIAVWLAVFLVRSRRLRQVAATQAAEEELTRLVLDQLAGYAPISRLPELPRWKRRILLRVLRELIAQTKGRDQAILIDFLGRAGFRAEALADLRRGPADRQRACQVLALFDDEVSLAALRRARRDRDGAVRLFAARALLQKDKVDSLSDLLRDVGFSADDPSLMLAELFAHLPARLRPEAVALLSSPLPPEWLRMLAIALARLQVGEAFDAIVALGRAESPRVRAASWVALRTLGDPRAAEGIGAGLRDPAADVRRAAAECAGVVGGPEIVPELVLLLDDDDWWVRYTTAGALRDFGPAGRAALQAHNATASHDTGRQLVAEREDPHHES